MGRDFHDAFPAARAVYEKADQLLGYELSRLCFEGPAERLNATDASQPAIFVTSVAIWEALKSAGTVSELAPQAMAGLSLGEYTALHLAGWIGFDDALRLVAERGRLMQLASEKSTGGMVSVMGVSASDVDTLCAEAAQGEVLGAANYNCPGQIVISGSKSACDRALKLVEKYNGKGVPLTVAGAFHSSLMGPAVEGLEKTLSATKISPGRIPVVSNVSSDYHGDPESVRRLLREQVAKPTRWQASIERLIADGYNRFAEVGPGRVLAGLMRKIDRSVAAVNYSAASALERVSA